MNTIHIALDIETLSTRSTAAVISIAAKCFTFSDSEEPLPLGVFFKTVNATTCAMYGLHFDQDTVNWWQRQSEDAKRVHLQMGDIAVTIRDALLSLNEYYKSACNLAKSLGQKPLIWCQGTDFDIAILRNAYQTVLGTDVPWPHADVRDSRTFIHSIAGLLHPEAADPYSLIPKNPDWHPHDALSDCDQLIWNVRHISRLLPSVGCAAAVPQP